MVGDHEMPVLAEIVQINNVATRSKLQRGGAAYVRRRICVGVDNLGNESRSQTRQN